MKDKKRPRVLDLGAGHGFMTWKMVVAGGNVTALEGQMLTALTITKTLENATPYLRPDEKINDVCQIVIEDMFNFSAPIYEKRFAVTFSGNVIHLMSPEQAQAYVENLFEITEEGGHAFATTLALLSDSKIRDFYKVGKANKDPYPGYMLLNKSIVRAKVENESGIIEDKELIVFSDPTNVPSGFTPTMIRYGTHQSPQKKRVIEKVTPSMSSTKSMNVERTHCAFYFLGAIELRKLFEEAQFIVEEIFYSNNKGERVNKDIYEKSISSSATTISEAYSVNIKARKQKKTDS